MLVRIAEGRPHTADLEYAEEGLARHPELQSPVAAIARGLQATNHQDAAQRMRTLQENARRNAADARRTNDAASQTGSGNNNSSPRARPSRDNSSPVPSRPSPNNNPPGPSRPYIDNWTPGPSRANNSPGPSRPSRDRDTPSQLRPSGSEQGPGQATKASGRDAATNQSRVDTHTVRDVTAQAGPSRPRNPVPGNVVRVQSPGNVEMTSARSTQVQAQDNAQGQVARGRRGTPSTKGGKTASRGKHHQGPSRGKDFQSLDLADLEKTGKCGEIMDSLV